MFGASVLVETHTPLTNSNGLANFDIGTGTPVLGSIGTIAWASGPYFLKLDIDPAGGTSYSVSSVTQFTSVPYALFSANGTPGPAGAQGPAGPQGATGLTGAAGPQGPAGATGAQRPQGAFGAQGPQGATGPTGTTGPAGAVGPAGATGATGIVGFATTSGSQVAVTADIAFLGPTVSLTILSGQKVMLTAHQAFGSTSVGGGTLLNLYPCSSNGSLVQLAGGGILALTVPQNQRQIFGLSHVFTGLASGTYTFGLGGQSSNFTNWNNGEWGFVSAIVFN